MDKIDIKGKTKKAIKIGFEKLKVKTKIDKMSKLVFDSIFFVKKKIVQIK